MRAMTSLISRVRSLLRRDRVERELEAELQFHLDQETAARIADGESAADARAAALRALGSVAHAKDGCRDSLGLRVVDALRQDLHQTARTLLHEPGFALVVIGSLALGIGGNTAIFQLINAVRLRTLPVADPREIVSVRVEGGNRGLGLSNGYNADLTFALWERVREQHDAFSTVFAWGSTQFIFGSGANAQLLDGLWVSGEVFPTLRLSPAAGRLLAEADDRRGCGTGGAVLSHAFWQRSFGGDRTIIGKTLLLMERPVPVVGVAPPGFFGLEVGKSFDVALPICAEATWGNSADRRDVWWLAVMGRLRPDWTAARASAHLNAISPGIFAATVPPGYRRESDDIYKGLRLAAAPAGNGSSRLRESYDAALWLLLAMTGIVLLVACVNLASLMLARATARQRDIAVRIALGASRRRVVFQFLAEGLALSVVGGAIGLALSSALSRGLVSLLDTEADPILIDVVADWRVLAFSATVAVATCLFFAVIPALRTLRGQPLTAIRDGGRGATRGRESFSIHRLLVASQIALSLILLAGALLFVRSFRNLVTLDAGFHQHGIVFAVTNFAGRNIAPDARSAYRQQLLDDIRSTPGVASAALTTYIPLANSSWSLAIRVPSPSGEKPGGSRFTYVSPRYFETMGIRLLAGRDFNDFDRADSRAVAIVNETFVKRYLGTANPIGAQMRTVGEPGSPPTSYEIIGVVGDTKYGNLRDATPSMTFVPITQNPDRRPLAIIAVRSAGNQDAIVSDLRNRFRTAHADLPARFTVFERQVQDGLSRERLMAWLAGFFGAVAATLVVIGLYGLLSYVVQRRTNEIGIRVALGATRSSIGGLVLRQTLGLVAAGLAIGVPVSVVAGRSAGSLLFGVRPTDAPTLVAAAALLAAIAICASLVPAWQAARVDPIRALRQE
jgi:predicted permease